MQVRDGDKETIEPRARFPWAELCCSPQRRVDAAQFTLPTISSVLAIQGQ